MNLTERAIEERALPPIWNDGAFSPARIDWYTALTIECGEIRGGEDVIPEFIAAMIWESSLDNLIIGNNAKNGSNNPYLGTTWCQLDTGYHVADLERMHVQRADPMEAILYVARTPDLCDQGGTQSHFNKRRWHAWWDKKEQQVDWNKLDPVDGWSALKAARDAWERVGD